jgi:hypothetical protein
MADRSSCKWIFIIIFINLSFVLDAHYCYKTPSIINTSLDHNVELFTLGFSAKILDFTMEQILCKNCRHVIPMFDDHDTCRSCRTQAGTCASTRESGCYICALWPESTWKKLEKSTKDAHKKRTKRSKSRDLVEARDNSGSTATHSNVSSQGYTGTDSIGDSSKINSTTSVGSKKSQPEKK